MASATSGDARPTLRCGDRTLPLGRRTYVMGILNVTPDSFSDGGQHQQVTRAVERAQAMLAEGVDVIDIGGESTRPGAAELSVDEEQARVLPVLEALAGEGITNLSLDTRRAEVARAGLAAGARWINDTDALQGEGMAEVAQDADAVVVMHWLRAASDGREDRVTYDDVTATVADFLAQRVDTLEAKGLDCTRLLVDPGIGFGKRLADNLVLTRSLAKLKGRAAGVLYGPSRKRFLGAVLEPLGTAAPERAPDRDAATVGAICFAAQRGADIVRVHDVASAVHALGVVDALARSESG